MIADELLLGTFHGTLPVATSVLIVTNPGSDPAHHYGVEFGSMEGSVIAVGRSPIHDFKITIAVGVNTKSDAHTSLGTNLAPRQNHRSNHR